MTPIAPTYKCGHPIDQWPYCNTGEAPIWMGDFSFRRLDKIRPGDEVIGFTTPEVIGNGQNRSQLVRTHVLAVEARAAHVVKVTLASGRVIRCTPDHQWVRRSPAGHWRRGDKQFGPAKVGDSLAFVVKPSMEPLTLTGAWLGGIYDGEGGGHTITQSPARNPEICKAIRGALTTLGIPFKEEVVAPTPHNKRGCNRYIFFGEGRHSLVKFLNQTRPIKANLIDRSFFYKGRPRILGGKFRTADRVVRIEPDGLDTVYSMQTGCGTYIAWGYASKNCRLSDFQYQFGVKIQNMRVSNVHHETALHNLLYLQEVEPDTWN